MILFLHNRYRVAGGEERAVEDLLWLVREHLGEEAELLERDSAALGRSRAAVALLRGGIAPDDVAAAYTAASAPVPRQFSRTPGSVSRPWQRVQSSPRLLKHVPTAHTRR